VNLGKIVSGSRRQSGALVQHDELVQLEEELRRLYASFGLDWVLAEVDLGIADGFQEERVVSRRRPEQVSERFMSFGWPEDSSADAPKRRDKPVIVVRPMTATERVQQLLIALRVVLVETPREESETFENLGAVDGGLTVSFVEESPRGLGEPHTMVIRADRVSSDLLEELRSKLDELLAAVND
jgi:hypothetical protein